MVFKIAEGASTMVEKGISGVKCIMKRRKKELKYLVLVIENSLLSILRSFLVPRAREKIQSISVQWRLGLLIEYYNIVEIPS